MTTHDVTISTAHNGEGWTRVAMMSDPDSRELGFCVRSLITHSNREEAFDAMMTHGPAAFRQLALQEAAEDVLASGAGKVGQA